MTWRALSFVWWPVCRLVLVAVSTTGCADEQQTVVLADSLALPASRVVELRAPEPLRTPALSRSGEVCLMLRPPLRRDTVGFAIRTGTAARVVPAVAIVREDGIADSLTQPSYLVTPTGDAICLNPDSAGALRPPYVAVRLRSGEPLQLGRVTWLSADR
ncbi:MAG TPA: hypothetical protein VG106_13255 [Vicinamibacterales bacterium]|nr:hypothetical protein [Vicinamibacterales bacterium]